MLYLAYRAMSPVEVVNEGGVGIILVDLETQVSAESVMEVSTLSLSMGKPVIATMSYSMGFIMSNGRQKAFTDVFQKLRKSYSNPKFKESPSSKEESCRKSLFSSILPPF